MTQVLKKFQLWLNQHYEGVRFYIGMVTAIVMIVVLLAQNATLQKQIEADRDQEKRFAQDIIRVLGALDTKTEEILDDGEKRTALIVCLLAIHGESDAISEEDKARCQATADGEVRVIEENPNLLMAPSNETPPPASSTPPPTSDPPPPPNEGLIPDGIPILGPLL